jgi:dihydrofolate synthase/folylpolyglutamate synthase
LPSPTFFEIGTALGFLHFDRRRCEVAVIEVGLGGRFDSTNVCRPLVAVITNVGLDHTAQLGHTLEAIAYQKAGIIKRRVPVVSGVTQDGPREVVRQGAAELDAPLWEQGVEFGWDSGSAGATVSTPHATYEGLRLGLPGSHQAQNAAVAVATIDRLREAGMPISDAAVARGLAEVRWPARVERVAENPTVILDTAHNVPSAEALVDTLRESFPVRGANRVIFAVSSDKPAADILRILATHFDHFHLTRYANNPRCVPPERLASLLEQVAPGKPYSIHATSADAWDAARQAAGAVDLICVTGSVFLAGELRPLLTVS